MDGDDNDDDDDDDVDDSHEIINLNKTVMTLHSYNVACKTLVHQLRVQQLSFKTKYFLVLHM